MRFSEQDTATLHSPTLHRMRDASLPHRASKAGTWRQTFVGVVIALVLLAGLPVFWP